MISIACDLRMADAFKTEAKKPHSDIKYLNWLSCEISLLVLCFYSENYCKLPGHILAEFVDIQIFFYISMLHNFP